MGNPSIAPFESENKGRWRRLLILFILVAAVVTFYVYMRPRTNPAAPSQVDNQHMLVPQDGITLRRLQARVTEKAGVIELQKAEIGYQNAQIAELRNQLETIEKTPRRTITIKNTVRPTPIKRGVSAESLVRFKALLQSAKNKPAQQNQCVCP